MERTDTVVLVHAAPVSRRGQRLAYQLTLPQFEGPLDVLLGLIERRELEVTAISVALVADQFLRHVATLDDQNPSLLADFVALGARLVLIKSRALLPRPADVAATDDGVEDDAALLAEQLAAYRQARATALSLAATLLEGRSTYPRPARPSLPACPPALAPHTVADLTRAVRRRLLALADEPQPAGLSPVVSLAMRVDQVLAMLAQSASVSLATLLEQARGRTDVVLTFMAILELIRRRQVVVEQSDLFGDMLIAAVEPA